MCMFNSQNFATAQDTSKVEVLGWGSLLICPSIILQQFAKTPLLHLINFILKMHILFPHVPNPYPAVCPEMLSEDFT